VVQTRYKAATFTRRDIGIRQCHLEFSAAAAQLAIDREVEHG
jgi:hypothetical protein